METVFTHRIKHFLLLLISLSILNGSTLFATETILNRNTKLQGTLIYPQTKNDENHLVQHPNGMGYIQFSPTNPACLNPVTNPCFAETPASLACVYHLKPSVPGCNPRDTSLQTPSGGWGIIGLAAAKYDANAYNDLTTFSD